LFSGLGMTWDEVKELGPSYAIGALDEETARTLEDFLREASPDQQREIARWHEVAALIPLALPSIPAPEHLRDRLLTRIAPESQSIETSPDVAQAAPEEPLPTEASSSVIAFTPARRSESSVTQWLLMAATVLLTLSSGYLLWKYLSVSQERDTLVRELRSLEDRFNHYISPDTRWISMSGEAVPQASAKVIWDTNQQTWVIYIFNLPPPPVDKVYQLWYVTKDAKVSSATFENDKVIKLTLPPQVVSGLAATAVTLEPKPGSKQPTGKFYLKAAI
jgi:hypothetical protein